MENSGLSLGPLRAAGVNLMVDRLDDHLRQCVAKAAALEHFYARARAVGASKDKADEAVRHVQGRWAGTPPSTDDLHFALIRLY